MKLIKSFMLTAAVLAGAEAGLRVFGPYFVNPAVRTDERGPHYIPDVRGAYMNGESGLLLRFETNAYGAKDGPWPDDGRPRVVVIGDSFTASRQVPRNFRFTEHAQSLLRARGEDVLVMNLGLDGTGPIHYLQTAHYAVKHLRPDVIVTVMSDATDFGPQTYAGSVNGEWAEYHWAEGRAVLRARPFTAREKFIRSAKDALKQLWLVRAAHDAVTFSAGALGRFAPGAPGGAAEKAPGCPQPGRPGCADEFYFAAAFDVIKRIRALSGGAFVAVQAPKKLSAAPAPAGCDPDRLKNMAAAAARAQGVELVQLHGAFAAAGAQYGLGHANLKGQKITAELLAPALMRALK